jgi:formylglycine-generating enzyme required for sulfatase activity
MHLHSLRVPVLATVSLGALLSGAGAQNGAKPSATVVPANGQAPRAAADDKLLEGLPAFLKIVPAGTVDMGLDVDAFLAAACQVVSESKPEIAAKISPAKVTEAMRRIASVLGRRKVQVESFLLAVAPVRNAEYETWVAERRKAGQKMRAPFHWWRIGCKEDFNERLPDVNKSFPKMQNAPLLYWDRHGPELPYKVQDDKGRPIGDLPVTHVSWREANEFAGRYGMRLPTEAEWTRAARGDGTNAWPLGTSGDPASDRFTSDLLKKLQIYSSREQELKAVGTVQSAVGPFGHKDMFGQVWQFVGDLGYRAINGSDPFAAEWKKLQKDKTGALLQAPPSWKDDRALAKGGSYLSAGEPIQLLIDTRAPVRTDDVMESLGFRLAKDLRPGFDYLYSMSRGSFNKGAFGIDQEIDLNGQVGAERYELDAAGYPTDYHAVSIAPVTWLSHEKNAELQRLLEKSMTTPMLIGAVACTSTLLEPAAPPGLYSLLYRKDGLPRDLVEAIKQGHRELAAMAKAKPKADAKADKPDGEGDGKDQKDDKGKKASWRDLIARFGLTEKDIEGKDAADGNLKFLRYDGIEVPTDRDCFLLHGNDGKIVAWVPATNAKPAVGNLAPSTLAIEANDKGKAVAKFHFGVPLSQANNKRVANFTLRVVFDRGAPTAEQPWRLPAK